MTKITLDGFHFLDAHYTECFLNRTLWTFGARNSLLWKAISLAERCLATSLTSNH